MGSYLTLYVYTDAFPFAESIYTPLMLRTYALANCTRNFPRRTLKPLFFSENNFYGVTHSVEQKDDWLTQVMVLISPMNMKHCDCLVYSENRKTVKQEDDIKAIQKCI